MANEYLKRTPTSTGNRKVWTWSGWVKRNILSNDNQCPFSAGTDYYALRFQTTDEFRIINFNAGSAKENYITRQKFRDVGNWIHILVTLNTTAEDSSQRIKLYVNGAEITDFSSSSAPQANDNTPINDSAHTHWIGVRNTAGTTLGQYFPGEITDVFLVDGQALTPDVFGYYKKGDGYISVGSTQATDFKRGQWVPKAPKVIKSVINARGGFGVNGFYLPMNDSTNFGADLHCAPNSIIKLKGEDEPQPYYGAPETTDAYVSQLREDPFKDYLVLAIPGIAGGKQNGFGDYSADIKGSGSNKIVSVYGNSYVLPTDSHYGSALSFDGANGTYLSISNDQDFHFGSGDFTIEFWQKAINFTDNPTGASMWDQANNQCSWLIYQNSGGLPRYYVSMDGVNANAIAINAAGPALATDQWHHIVMEREGSILRGYVNGVVVGINTTLGSQSIFTPTKSLTISEWGYNDNGNLNGFIQDLRIYKGVAKYKGGFDVPKPYTPVGISTWRAVPDCTANNFATLNPLHGSTSGTYTNGNLTIGNPGTANIMEYHSTIGMTQGKWYCEARVDQYGGNNYWHFGVSSRNLLRDASNQNGSNAGDLTVTSIDNPIYRVTYEDHNAISYNGGSPSDQLVNGDIVGVAVSITTPVASAGAATTIFGTVQFYRNGSTYGNELPLYRHQLPLTGVGGTTPYTIEWFFAAHSRYGSYTSVNFGQNPTFSGNTTAGTYTDSNGKGLFKYEPPSGFLALCEDNLPTPAIADPGKHFKTVLWTGDGNSGRSITGLGFQPDFVWIKERSNNSANALFDSVRGAAQYLSSNATSSEVTFTDTLSSFDSNGFSINNSGALNANGDTYVAWCWKAGGEAVTNTDGTITSQVSVNQDAGFSIVSYTGNGSTGTIGHGLGKTPSFVIVKGRTNISQWLIWHNSLTGSQFLEFNSNVVDSAAGAWNDTLPNSTTISLGSSPAASSDFIAYCWAEIEGFSKFGSYVGNASADGPFVYCGFKPAWVMIRNATLGGYWNVWDSSRTSTNPCDKVIFPNAPDIEASGSGYHADFLSNGFKIRTGSASHINGIGDTIIFAAFAESPFQTANSK